MLTAVCILPSPPVVIQRIKYEIVHTQTLCYTDRVAKPPHHPCLGGGKKELILKVEHSMSITTQEQLNGNGQREYCFVLLTLSWILSQLRSKQLFNVATIFCCIPLYISECDKAVFIVFTVLWINKILYNYAKILQEIIYEMHSCQFTWIII